MIILEMKWSDLEVYMVLNVSLFVYLGYVWCLKDLFYLFQDTQYKDLDTWKINLTRRSKFYENYCNYDISWYSFLSI